MKEIIITTQAEFDALPQKFTEYTRIVIRDTTSLLVVKTSRENSSVVAWGNSSVEAWGNSSVEARGNSSVVAWENSSVEAWGNSSVEAWENSSVVARGNCIVRIFSASIKLALYGFAVAFLPIAININIEKLSKHCHVQIVQDLGWFERNAVKKTPTVTLYKRVSKELKTQEGTANETLWAIGATLTHPAWNPKGSECNGGKFHACSRPYFCDEFRCNKGDRYVAIAIKRTDLYEWKDSPRYPHKIAFRTGKVLYECDRFGKEIKR